MANQVKWFEVLGKDGPALRSFYGDLFGWQFNDAPGDMDYGMVDGGEGGISGGVGTNPEGAGYATFYAEVDDVQAALDKAQSLGGRPVVGPMQVPNGPVVGMFADPEGHTVGVYAPSGEGDSA
jgi:predicted enzyme related to lactoylglutathione lyase